MGDTMKKSFILFTVTLILFFVTDIVHGQGNIFIVTSKEDSGSGTFRQALQDAKSGDTIIFNTAVFPPGSPDTIFLASPLPNIIQGNLVIDASNSGVVINGSKINMEEFNGLHVVSNNNIIRGLQLKDFSKAGIAIEGDVKNNIIGGDRNAGEGPSGQGNMVTGEGSFGIALWSQGTSFNTIRGNIIGTDPDGTTKQGSFSQGINLDGANNNLVENNLISGYLEFGVAIGNISEGYNTIQRNYIGTDFSGEFNLGSSNAYGIILDNSGNNIIGPDNVITNNGLGGILIYRENAQGNLITQNSIYKNGRQGILLQEGSNNQLIRPYIFEFNLEAGTLTGITCPKCTAEIFSDSTNQGEIYEGSTIANDSGLFTFSKEAPFIRPHLTATATDINNNTSQFSPPTQNSPSGSNFIFQEGNYQKLVQIQSRTSSELPNDTRLQYDINPRAGTNYNVGDIAKEVLDIGAKLVSTTFNEGEGPINWDVSETEIPVNFDLFIDEMNKKGVAVNYMIHYWDKIGHAAGEELPNPRFKTQDEIDKFLDYVRLIVSHFIGRVQYYTIWDEPGACGGSVEMDVKCIEPLDYVNLVKQTIPVIHEVDPQAKIITGPVVIYHSREHLFTLLSSDAIQLFDVICTHPFFDQAPDQNYGTKEINGRIESRAEYYYKYRNIIDSILQTASDQGFKGEYWGQGLTWFIKGVDVPDDQPDSMGHTKNEAMKYYARAVVMHLGLDYGISSAVNKGFPEPYYMVANLFTILAGTNPINLAEEIKCETEIIRSYGFTHPDGYIMLAYWNDNEAADNNPGVPAIIKLPGFTDKKVFGIDVLNGFEQELVTEAENDSLVIRNLLIKDYPIILRFGSKPVGINDKKFIDPGNYKLDNYPDPFNTTTTIEFQVSGNSNVSIKIINIQGQEIRNIVNKEFEPGFYDIEWNGLNNMGKVVPSGVYLIRMECNNYVKTKKCLFLK
jgi:parallel beta-helix repeat protein